MSSLALRRADYNRGLREGGLVDGFWGASGG
jgi:hypothetical protein